MYKEQKEWAIEALSREINKRNTTYPKMVEKAEPEDRKELSSRLESQMSMLHTLKNHLKYGTEITAYNPTQILRELQRELRMRNSMYPRFVRFGMMKKEEADDEILTWQGMTKWYHEQFCPNAPWRKHPKEPKP